MKKNILVALFAISIVHLWGYDITTAQKDTVHVFEVGNGGGEISFGPINYDEPYSPTSLCFLKNGDLLIVDPGQGVMLYDKAFKYLDAGTPLT